MKCPKCGVPAREGSSFCHECGTSLEEYGIAHQSSPVEEENGPGHSGRLSPGVRRKIIISFVIFDIALAVLMMIYFLRL